MWTYYQFPVYQQTLLHHCDIPYGFVKTNNKQNIPKGLTVKRSTTFKQPTEASNIQNADEARRVFERKALIYLRDHMVEQS